MGWIRRLGLVAVAAALEVIDWLGGTLRQRWLEDWANACWASIARRLADAVD